MNAALLILCTAVISLPAVAASAQFVEIEANFEVTRWTHQEETGLRLKNTRTYPVHCVVGTNLWLIEHQPRTNVTESSWLLNGKIIRINTVVRDSPYDDTGYGRRGSRSASILPAPDGYPGGELLVNVPWFAFCSGPYLRTATRGVPIPTSPPDRAAFGFTNETTFFADKFRLPRRAAFYAPPRQLKCLYETQQSTNVLGWNFPTAFTVTHSEPDRFGIWQSEVAVKACVIAIRPAPGFAAPQELFDLLKSREQSPGRRRGGFRSDE